jgi:dihydroflavonol-4-reductase
MKMPYSISLMLSYVYQLFAGIARKPPMLAPALVRVSRGFYYYDCSKAVNEPGLPQTPIRTTIEKAVNWFRENGYVKSDSMT